MKPNTATKNPAAVSLGRMGGIASAANITPAKREASRRNGARGGRPKSRFTLWISTVNGGKRWGINERRDYGTYTVGPHNGFDSRGAAEKLLRKMRIEESDRNAELKGSRP